jgi:small-conductance mechanosensitive channel
MPARAVSADPQASTATAGPAEAQPLTDAPAVVRPVDRAPDRLAEPAFRSTETTPATPVRTRQPAVDPQVAELGHTVAALSGDIERLQDDNRRLQNTNQRLTELNAQLRQEVESLGLELQTVRERANQRWVLYGAGLVLLGLLAGVLLKARPRRSAWS